MSKRHIFLLCAVLLFCITGCTPSEPAPIATPWQGHELSVHFLNVGKADSILITQGGHAILIDTATNKMGEEVCQYLAQQNIQQLDLLILTHFDKDHVGGADAVLNAVPVNQILEAGYTANSKQFEQYRSALEAANLQAQPVTRNTTVTLGELTFEIDVAATNYEQENDNSLIIRMQYGESVFLFAADAENPRLTELLNEMNLACNVLKVPHHGREERLSSTFFAACNAEYAIITSDADEPEDEAVLQMLKACGTQTYLTRNGTVIVQVTAQGHITVQTQP